MPYIITSLQFPTHKVEETVATFFEELKKFSPDETLGTTVVQGAVTNTTQGMKTMTIMEVKKGKLEEALKFATKTTAMYNDIVGLEYSIDVWLTAEEALVGLGLG